MISLIHKSDITGDPSCCFPKWDTEWRPEDLNNASRCIGQSINQTLTDANGCEPQQHRKMPGGDDLVADNCCTGEIDYCHDCRFYTFSDSDGVDRCYILGPGD